MEQKLSNKQRRQVLVTNKDRWARRKLSNKYKRKAFRKELEQKKA
jgi:hypothetical protein